MSGTAISVWSKLIEPGQDTLITEDVSIQITQIALELPETLVADNATKRSILKMQFLEAEPALLSAAAGLNSDDEDDFEDDDDEDSDDEEIDSDDAGGDESMADLSKISKASTSSKKSNEKAAAAAAAAAAEEEDDDEDDEEEDDDFEFDRQEAEVQIASLIPGRIEHINTNIVLVGGDDYVLKLSGDYKVHLLGNYIVQPIPEQFQRGGADGAEYDSELESDFDDEDMEMFDEDEEDEEEEARIVEIEEKKQPAKKAAKEAAAPATKAVPAAVVAAEAVVDASKLSKNQKKKLAKELAAKAAPEPAAPAPAKAAAPAKEAPAAKEAKKAPSKKQTLKSGLVIEEGKIGTGPTAKAGQRVSMRYIGRLDSGKIFDQNTKGPPFSFKLGKGEVIKGWDQGVPGMQAGGERKLVIPAELAYGKQAISGIPANSTLTFEIKLLSLK